MPDSSDQRPITPKVGHRVTPAARAEADTAARRRADWNERNGRPNGRAETIALRESDHNVPDPRDPLRCMRAIGWSRLKRQSDRPRQPTHTRVENGRKSSDTRFRAEHDRDAGGR